MKKYTVILTVVLAMIGLTSVGRAAVGSGLAALIAHNKQVVEATFDGEQQVTLDQVRVGLTFLAKVDPAQAQSEMDKLGNLQTADGKKFQITGINRQQGQDNVGLTTLTVQLSGILPLTDLAQVQKLTEAHSKSGSRLSIAAVQPYLSAPQRQKIQAELSQQLYRQTQAYLKSLNAMTGKHYTVAQMTFGKMYRQNAPLYPAPAVRLAVADAKAAAPVANMQQTFKMDAKVTFVS